MDQLTQSEAKAYRRKSGIPRKLKLYRRSSSKDPHPGRGGSRGYPVWFRRIMLKRMAKGKKIPPRLKRSLRRWKNRLVPFEMIGNKQTGGLSGHHRFLLAIVKKIYPHASLDQCAVFIAVQSIDFAVFTRDEISKTLQEMDMTRKKASTTAYAAFTPENVEKHYCFWHYRFPAGVYDVPRRDLIDSDEAAFCISDADQSFGHGVKGMRVRKFGNYLKGSAKLCLIIAVETGDPCLDPLEDGSIEKPRLWYRLSTDGSTTRENYIDFLNYDLMDHFEANERPRTIMHDNLSSHKAAEVFDTIHDRGHRVICRPPYRPNEAPIEFVIDQVACEVRRRWTKIKDVDDLDREVRDVLDTRAGLGGFDKLFVDCGYKFNG